MARGAGRMGQARGPAGVCAGRATAHPHGSGKRRQPGCRRSHHRKSRSLQKLHCQKLAWRIFTRNEFLAFRLPRESVRRPRGNRNRRGVASRARLSADRDFCLSSLRMDGDRRCRHLAVGRCLEVGRPPYQGQAPARRSLSGRYWPRSPSSSAFCGWAQPSCRPAVLNCGKPAGCHSSATPVFPPTPFA
jgi:hypothetical protein